MREEKLWDFSQFLFVLPTEQLSKISCFEKCWSAPPLSLYLYVLFALNIL